jgi:transposase
MTRKNKYAHRSKISEAKFRELVRLFAADLDAGQIAEIARLNRNTVNRYLRLIRLVRTLPGAQAEGVANKKPRKGLQLRLS